MKKFESGFLHVVAFDVPYPSDYGGVIDIFHKIRILNTLGYKIILHCYHYGRPESPELNDVCHSVFYYKRKTYKNPFYGKVPYIVSTRNSGELLKNLQKDEHPILFEGLHTTFFLKHESLQNRVKIVRNHNIEHDYYKNLESVEDNFFKKYFFRVEAERLKTYEKVYKSAGAVLSISPKDHETLNKRYHNSHFISAFHPNDEMNCKTGKGEFLFYHGNLSVGENNHAALFLVNEVFSKINYPVIIAGNNPSAQLRQACLQYNHISLNEDWNNEQILDHIQKAQINVLPTFQATGIKLKLLNALYLGRHCLVNTPMVANTGLESLCTIANTASDFVKEINHLWNLSFKQEQADSRVAVLKGDYDNYNNGLKINSLIKELSLLLKPAPIKPPVPKKKAAGVLSLFTLLLAH
ncbi:MAG: glycosyltransferase family 1 protein [Bacteroidia bacterium]|nr:glycosyltransferase family 1 protein [Bacteroidia bacterium]